MKKITTPLNKTDMGALSAGDEVLLTGTIYTARDQAHKRICEILKSGEDMPVDLKGALIYYSGPTPARPGKPIGSCGPTTSVRMDEFTPALLEHGIAGMIGKGPRSEKVRHTIAGAGSIYFLATGGLGALLATKVTASKCVAFKELGPEAIYRLEVKDFPLIVGIDVKGNDLYEKR